MVVVRQTTVWKARGCRTEIRENQNSNRCGQSIWASAIKLPTRAVRLSEGDTNSTPIA
jgi:hypothetical protein